MCKEEFIQLLNDAGINYGNVQTAEQCFHAALMTSVDEIGSSKHLEMSYVEFLEAFARVVDRPIQRTRATLVGGLTNWGRVVQATKPLFRKIEIQIIKLLKLL